MRNAWRVSPTPHMRWIMVGIVLFALLMAMIVAVLRMTYGDSGDHPATMPTRSPTRL